MFQKKPFYSMTPENLYSLRGPVHNYPNICEAGDKENIICMPHFSFSGNLEFPANKPVL